MKYCSGCKQEKSFDQFSRDCSTKSGYQSYCKSCNTLNAAKRRAKNPKRHRRIERKWRKNNPEKIKLSKQKYAIENPEKVNAAAAKHRALKIDRTPNWLTENDFKEIESIYLKAQDISLATGILHEVDHIVPLNGKEVSGLHVPWNLRVVKAFGPEGNRSKGNKLLTALISMIE